VYMWKSIDKLTSGRSQTPNLIACIKSPCSPLTRGIAVGGLVRLLNITSIVCSCLCQDAQHVHMERAAMRSVLALLDLLALA
jgi:hypothetical protein